MGGDNNATATQGFTFNPAPLSLNGQSIGGGLNFTSSNAVAQVDQASQAYGFISGINNAAYNFVTGANNAVLSFDEPFFQGITQSLGNIGTTEANAMQTAASKLSSGCSGFSCLF